MDNCLNAPYEVSGLAFSSPILLSPGLQGKQGWSPCTSACGSEADCDELFVGSPFMFSNAHGLSFLSSSADSHGKKVGDRHMTWPLPPDRLPLTRPLNVKRNRAMSTVILSDVEGRQWPHGKSKLASESSKRTDRGRLYSPDSMSGSSESCVTPPVEHSTFKRFFSVPMREATSMLRDDTEPADDGVPPLMPEASYKSHDWEDEEAVKLNRLHASFSLLGLRHEPSPLFTATDRPDDAEDANKTICADTGDADEPTPTAGLCLLDLAMSPERPAPSLAEQMAFASGLGNQCSWASPRKQIYASADGYLPSQALPAHNDPDGDLQRSMSAQEDRRMSSRHVRLNCAARRQSIHFVGEDIGSNDETPSLMGTLETFFDEDKPIKSPGWLESPVRNLSTRSTGASTIVSMSSPILNGALSASEFASSDVDSSPEPIHDAPVLSRQVPSLISDRSSSRASLDSRPSPTLTTEFSYLANGSDFLAEVDVSPKYAGLGLNEERRDRQVSSNTMSSTRSVSNISISAISTPPIDALPSPVLDAESCRPARSSVAVEDGHDSESVLRPWASMPKSVSTTSILDRPRPRTARNSGAACFFARGDPELARLRSQSVRTGLAWEKSDRKVSSGMSARRSTHKPTIPTRTASLEKLPIMFDQSTNSNDGDVTITEQPRPRMRAAVSVPAAHPIAQQQQMPSARLMLPPSRSVGALSPRAMAQVQEVCRLKEQLSQDAEVRCRDMAYAHVRQRTSPEQRKPAPSAAPAIIQKVLEKEQADAMKVQRLPARNVCQDSTMHDGLPTLFVARTNSQRRRGATGILATEPRNIELARRGGRVDFATRSSTVVAAPRTLQQKQRGRWNDRDQQEEDEKEQALRRLRSSKSMTSLPLTMHRNLGIGLPDSPVMPAEYEMEEKREAQRKRELLRQHGGWMGASAADMRLREGVVLVLEETKTTVEQVLSR